MGGFPTDLTCGRYHPDSSLVRVQESNPDGRPIRPTAHNASLKNLLEIFPGLSGTIHVAYRGEPARTTLISAKLPVGAKPPGSTPGTGFHSDAGSAPSTWWGNHPWVPPLPPFNPPPPNLRPCKKYPPNPGPPWFIRG